VVAASVECSSDCPAIAGRARLRGRRRIAERADRRGTGHWSTRSLAAEVGLSQTAVSRIWRAFGLQPHRQDTWKRSKDPQFIDEVRDVVGLYLNPPERAVMLCVDEKAQIQALDRPAPVLPMLPGTPAEASHDYVRNGTSSLYAALDLATGRVIGSLHARHRAIELKKFLTIVDREVPADQQFLAQPGRTLVQRAHDEETATRHPPQRPRLEL
jgi:hypothetical protein